MQISIRSNIDEVLKNLNDIAKKQIPYAVSLALNRTGQKVKDALIKSMKESFDRPTPFTLNALQHTPSTKKTLTTVVCLKTPVRLSQRQHYFVPNILGVNREYKAFERALFRIGILPAGMMAVPGSAANIDLYGNMSRGQIIQILSYFKAFGEQGYKANITEARKKRLAKGSKKKIGYTYFVLQRPRGRLPAGIYQRFSFAMGTAIKPILIFVPASMRYKKRWDFFGIGRRVVEKEFENEFIRALLEAIKTAK